MAEKTFYYEFKEPGNQYSPGVYTNVGHRMGFRMYNLATRVWRQGSRGGVKIIKENLHFYDNVKSYGEMYVTKNEEAMKEFMWVKLQAQPYNEGA